MIDIIIILFFDHTVVGRQRGKADAAAAVLSETNSELLKSAKLSNRWSGLSSIQRTQTSLILHFLT